MLEEVIRIHTPTCIIVKPNSKGETISKYCSYIESVLSVNVICNRKTELGLYRW